MLYFCVVMRKVFVILTLLLFFIATNGVALYHCCCGISVVEEMHACCGSKKACETHLHYSKLDNVFQHTCCFFQFDPHVSIILFQKFFSFINFIARQIHLSAFDTSPPIILSDSYCVFLQVFRL
jgi:hypothetical protein